MRQRFPAAGFLYLHRHGSQEALDLVIQITGINAEKQVAYLYIQTGFNQT